ncbi:hypothetical protein [Flavihumibacter petaseus]|uniref:Glycosidase n=1 Tax=Flavihumibacter petaseus NBRC 106054 TaxID=1220578 RepID=A0A0E9MV16_9BACT|nr:hypothetical protein [Flavihumibacter petaseus]GAO41592.1 glycosidase [Flavihumibacter petaseus NBRC 106054]
MNLTTRWILLAGLLCVSVSGFSQQAFNAYFTPAKKYLQLPVKNGAPKKNVEIWKDGVLVRFFDIELSEDRADWFAYLDISEWKGDSIELRVDKLALGSPTFHPVVQSDLDTNSGKLYSEALRGQFHFSPQRGWTNDPNGMCFYQGQYHLFFQHNPYGRGWGNMTWGHAVSKDMIHWKEIGDALHPDGYGPMFSGTAVVDSNNTSGFGKPGTPAMVMFFTGAKAWCQGLAWTTDGMYFQKMDHAAVPRVRTDNRDPKVFWYAPGNHWVMLFWVEQEGGQHSMQFLRSDNLKDWTKTSIVRGGVKDDRYLHECPDFFELPVDGNPANTRWVLSAANSVYAIGSFDGKTFRPDAERLVGQVGRGYYAAQTFSNEPTGRRIEIGWWQTATDKGDMAFNQSMTIPMELKLITTPEGIRMVRIPVKELETLRRRTIRSGAISLSEKSDDPLGETQAELLEFRMVATPGKSSAIHIDIRGLEVLYDAAAGELSCDGIKAKIPLQQGNLQLTVYADRTGLEIFANNGLYYMPVNKNISGTKSSISVTGGKCSFKQLDVFELKAAWE